MSAEDTAKQVLAKVGVWWPDADEGKLRQAADAWRAAAAAVEDVAAAGSSAARRVESAVEGDAGDAFQTFWAKYDGSGGAYLPATAQACRQLAAACDQYADAVHTAKRRLEELAAEIGATLVVGTALAFFTFGISEGAAAATTAALVASAEAIGVEVSATVASIVGSALTYAAFGAVEGAAVDVAVAQPIRVQMFHDGGYSLHETAFAALTGGVTGGVLGGGGRALTALRDVHPAAPTSPAELPVPRWDPADGMPVLGRLTDTSVAEPWPAHAVLDDPAWTIERNDAWIESIIRQKGTVYVGSPLENNLWDAAADRPTVFGRELNMLLKAGYEWSGDHLIPPAR